MDVRHSLHLRKSKPAKELEHTPSFERFAAEPANLASHLLDAHGPVEARQPFDRLTA
jgi:hypothetical protein